MHAPSELSSRLAPYEVIETAYAGDFFVVYRCLDRKLQREVSIKGVRCDGADPVLASRYASREAHVRRLLAHPHILPLYELAGDESQPLLVGPWLAGGSLRDVGRPLSATEALALAQGVGSALDVLHAAGWSHGDVSPGNVLLHARPELDGPAVEAVLTDFGTARRIGTRAVRRGGLRTTPHVTAPEVWAGSRVDGRADLYSLGVLLYHALTGAWPFEASEPAAFADLHCRAAVPRPAAKAVGPAVSRVLLRGLAKRPVSRYATGAELATALQEALTADGLHFLAVPQVRPDGDAAVSAGKRLDRFAASLGEREQVALRRLLRQSIVAEARARDETEQIAMQVLAPAAALVALEECGAATALAAGHRTPAKVAAACGAPEEPIRRLLELLAAVGLLGRDEAGYRLPPGPAALYAPYLRAQPVREAAGFWAHLPHWAATGKPLAHMDRQDGALYAGSATRLGLLTAPAARELAEALRDRGLLPAGAAILDVGAGSGVWGFALARVSRDSTVTALDRPRVLDAARENARSSGLERRFRELPGDWWSISLAEGAFDVAVLANVCHLEPAGEVRRLLRRVRAAVRRGGIIAVVDTMPDADTVDVGALLQALHLALRTPGGGVHPRGLYERWLREAGFEASEPIALRRTESRLTTLVARRLSVEE